MLRLESSRQAEILTKLRARKFGGFAYKHEPSPVGMPDICFIELGVVYFFEVKRTSKDKPTDIQKLRHRQLSDAGSVVHVVWSWKQVKDILNGSL